MSKAKFWISNHRFIVVIFAVLFAVAAVVALGVTYQRVSAAPIVIAAKTDILIDDVDGDLVADPGDTLEYDVVVINTGSTSAGSVRFLDTVDFNTTFFTENVGVDAYRPPR